MYRKSKQVALSAPQLSKLTKLMHSFEVVADQKISKKVGKGKGDTNSIRTQEATRQVMKTVFLRLFELGFQVEDIKNLQRRHVEKLVQDWYTNGVQPKTINNYVSIIRKCCGWIGKTTLVPAQNALVILLPNVEPSLLKVSCIAVKSKSWTEQGIDVVAKILQADAICIVFGAMLRLALAFGLRRKEQLRCKPSHIDGSDKVMLRGSVSKTARDRDIEIVDPFQRFCLDYAKKIAGRGRHLGWEGMTMRQAQNHYNYLMGKKLGITGKDADCVGHGLRAEFAENMALRLGFVPPTLGGAGDQMPREAVRPIRAKVSRQMGHNRLTTTNAYYGSVTGRPQALGRKVCSLWIGDGLMASLHINPTPLKNDAGEYFKLTEVQLDRAAVHVQIDRDGQSQAVGVWRIKGFSMASLGDIEGIDLVQRQVLSEKLQLVMAPMGWVV